jgi:hypothetical protein
VSPSELGFGDGKEVRVQRNFISRAERMFRVGKNLYLPEVLLEQSAQARPRKEIHVTAFEQMPGNGLPIL